MKPRPNKPHLGAPEAAQTPPARTLGEYIAAFDSLLPRTAPILYIDVETGKPIFLKHLDAGDAIVSRE
jgi:hypothetical protein